MKYFIDTEFLEGTQKTLFSKTKPTIDLISIGIVCEDGREYYAISKDFNLKEAWNRYDLKKSDYHPNGIEPSPMIKVYWVKENVLKPIWKELRAKEVEEYNIAQNRNVVLDFPTYSFTYKSFKRLLNKYGKTNKQIAKEIIQFVVYEDKGRWLRNSVEGNYIIEVTSEFNKNGIQFYGYYSDYDWVVFCWLFGRMIDLPKGFPMYCIDKKQQLDEKAMTTYCNDGSLNSETSLEKRLQYLKGESKSKLIEPHRPVYPKQTNEHNALEDAKWNYELYKFLQSL